MRYVPDVKPWDRHSSAIDRRGNNIRRNRFAVFGPPPNQIDSDIVTGYVEKQTQVDDAAVRIIRA
jgi:hypothetical protein